MADLRNKGPLRSLITDEAPTNQELLTPEEGFVPDTSQAFAGGDFESGLQTSTRSLDAGKFYRKADKAEAKGDNDAAQALREHAIRLEEASAGFAPRVGSSADVKGFGDAIDFAQAGFGQLAPTMAATSVPGIIGGVAGGILTGGNPLGIAAGAGLAAGFAGFEMEAGEAASEQQADEVIRALPVEQRLREQNIKGAQAAALELVFPTMVGGRLAGSVAKIFKKLDKVEDAAGAAKAAKRLDITKKAGRVNVAEATAEEGGGAALSVLKETASEAGTEASQTLVGQASLTRLNPNRDRSHDVQELIDATILGALGGGGISLGTTIPGALAKKALGAKDVELDEDGAPKPTAGQRVRDKLIKAGAGVGGAVKEGAAKIKDSDIVKGAKVRVKEPKVASKVTPKEAPAKERLSDAELERRARLRKSAFTPGAQAGLNTVEDQVKQEQEDAAAEEDFAASSRFEASAEEITGLRELDPISKEESKGQRRFVRMQTADVDSHLSDLVARGVLTQEVADSAKVEPLGTNMERKGASVQDMENELSGIVRDIVRRIEDGRKKGGTATEIGDRNKALESELANLPLDVSKVGEKKIEGTTTTEVVARTEHKRKAGTKDQSELFPEDIGQSFPVPIKEFRKNHFGFQIELQQEQKQGELDLGKTNRRELLVRALNRYGKVLASDAAAGASAATVAEHKANRSKYEQATGEEKRELERTGKVLRLRKKNGQNEIIDAESVIQTALKADREGITNNVRGKAKQDEAALAAGLASELLRNDIEGVIDPQTNKVAKGSRVQDLLGNYVTGTGAVSEATRVADTQKKAAQDKAVTGKRPRKSLKKGDIRRVIAGEKRSVIQKGFNQARKDHLLIDTKEGRDARKKVLNKAAKAQRKVLADLRKFNKEYAENKHVGPGLTELQREENNELIDALKAKYGEEVGVLFGNRQRTGTAEMRADRLEALIEDLNELQIEETAEGAGIAEEAEGGKAKTTEPTGVRHAAEQTGAGTQVPVNQRFGGQNRQQKVSKKASARAKSQFERLATRLREVESAQAARQLVSDFLGYKITTGGTFVLLGDLAKKAHLRTAINDSGVPLKGTAEVLPGERVTVLVAKADLNKIMKSNEMTQLLASGAEIVMPAMEGKALSEFHNNGYKELKQADGLSVWVPALGEKATVSSRNAAFNPLAQQAAEISDIASFSLFGDRFNDAWDKAKQAKDKLGEASDPFAKSIKEWIEAQMADGLDIDTLIAKAQDALEAAARKTGRLAFVGKRTWTKTLEMLQAAKDKAIADHKRLMKEIEEDKASGAFEERGLRKKLAKTHPPGKIELMVRESFGMEEVEAKAWVKENYDAVIDIFVRRGLIEQNPDTGVRAPVEGFNEDFKAQAKVIQEVFGARVAKRIGIINDQEELLGKNFKLTFEGKEVVLKGGRKVSTQVMAFIMKVAPASTSIILSTVYWQQMQNLGLHIHALLTDGGAEKIIMTDNREGFRLKSKSALGGVLELPGMTALETRDDVIEFLWGEAGKGKTNEELLDLPIINGLPDTNRNTVLAKTMQKKLKAAFGGEKQQEGKPLIKGFQKGMTLRAALDGKAWLEENADKIDVEFTGDLESLITTEVGFSMMMNPGAMGLYTPTEDRIFLMGNNMHSPFHVAWIAWHELHHRGVAVKFGANVEQMLTRAQKNPTIAKLAKAIRLERTIMGDKMGANRLGATEEALMELAAAINTGDFQYLEAQYGVKVSENLKKPLESLVAEFVELMKKVMNGILELIGGGQELKSDIEVLEILKGVRDTALNAPTNRARAAESLKGKGIDLGLKFSRETTGTETLTDQERADRRTEVRDWLATVLGDDIANMFRDVLSSETDVAGSYDWKTTVIELAIDSASWYGTAAHEAFHAFFHKMGKIDGNKAVYNRLLKAANAPHIKRQLRALLKDSPEALAQLADPEERLAYMFQFYATEQINLQPQTLKTFRKWARKLGELLGIVSKHESAERIFSAFLEGDLRTGFQIRDMLMEEQATGFAKSMNSIINPIAAGLNAVLASATDRLRNTGNKSLTRIANLFAPEVRAGGEAGYIANKARQEAQFRNGFDAILEEHAVEGEDRTSALKREKEALSILQGQLDAEEGTLASDLRKYLVGMFEYLRDEDNDVFNDDGTLQSVSPNAVHQLVAIREGKKIWEVIKNEGGRYFPRAWDINMILNNWSEFVQIMEEEGGLEGEALSNFKHALEQSDGMVDIDLNNAEFDAAMRAVNSRTFEFINQDNAHRFSKFQEQDLTNILTKYARQAANRGEQTRHFGIDNEKLDKLLDDAKKEGASQDEIKMAEKAIKALEGTLGAEAMSPLKKNLMMTAMTAVNFAVLPLALFSSLVDPLGVLVRTGSLPAAARTFQAGAAQIVADIRGSSTQHQKFAEFMGIVEQEQMLAVTGDAYNSSFQNETLRKLNARFFKIIGLDSWTKGTRIGAMVAGMLYMRDIAADGNIRALEELGLREGDIQMSATQPDYVEVSPEVLGRDKARRVQAALFRMVDESILRPSAAQRPIFMSDIRFMLLGHLKQFTFSFHNTIVKQVSNNINNRLDDQDYIGAMQQLAPLLAYVPMMIAADMLRAAVGGRLDDDDDKEWSLGSTIFEGVQRSAILGTRTFALDAGEEAFGFNSLPISTFLGPVISKGTKLTEAAIDPDTSFMKAGVKMLPGYAFWKGWMQ